MNRRLVKVAALVFSGGLVFQLTGCAGILIQLLLRNVLEGVISTAINAADPNTAP